MNDARLDQLIRNSLESHSTRVASAQPSLRQASSRLAGRVGPSLVLRPHVTMTPASAGGLNLLMIVLLLLALAAAVAFVGSLLLRTAPPDLRPGPFGFASDCGVQLPDGVALEVYANDRPITVLASGVVITDLSSGILTSPEQPPGLQATSRVETIHGTSFGQRQLNARGLAMLIERLTTEGITSGCIGLRSADSEGSITARTPSGYARLSWGPEAGAFGFARRMSPEEEELAVELLGYLSSPETSLPDEAWAEDSNSTITPDQWLVSLRFVPTELPPGAVVGLPNGELLEGSDPRYEQVQLPNGGEPLTFGTEYELADVSHLRCGILSTDDALILAGSLDSTFGSEREWMLHTPDMAHEVVIDITPAFPHGHSCDDLAAAMAGPTETVFPSPSSSPATGEPVAEEPCSLLPSVVMLEGRRWTDELSSQRSEIPLGRPAQACWLIDTADPWYDPADDSSAVFARRLTLTLHPGKLARLDAAEIAETVMGYETAQTKVSDLPVWENDCLASAKPCAPVAAFWDDGRLFFVQFHYANLMNPVLPLDEARAQVAAIIEALR